MNRPMPPPGGPGMSGPPGPQQTPQPAFSQPLVGGGTSHPNSPAQNPMNARSPSLVARQPPNGAHMEMIQQDLLRIEASKLSELKAEFGINKDLLSMSPDEKVRAWMSSRAVPRWDIDVGMGGQQRLVGRARQRNWLQPPKPGAQNAAAGPSNMNMQQPPNPRGGMPPQLQTPQNHPRSVKRSSTSPGDDVRLASSSSDM